MAVLFVCFFKQLVFLKALLPFLTVLSPYFSYLGGGGGGGSYISKTWQDLHL